MDAMQGVLGAERGLEGVFDQGDVRLSLRVLNATELLGHGEKVGGHLAGVHQQHSPADGRQTGSVGMCEHEGRCKQDAIVVVLQAELAEKGMKRDFPTGRATHLSAIIQLTTENWVLFHSTINPKLCTQTYRMLLSRVDSHGFGALAGRDKALLFSHQSLKGNPCKEKRKFILLDLLMIFN